MKKLMCLFTLLGFVAAPCAYAQPQPVAPQAPILEIEDDSVVPAMPSARAAQPAARPAQAAGAVKGKRMPRQRPTAADNKAMMGKVAPAAKQALDAQSEVVVETVTAPLPAEAQAALAQPQAVAIMTPDSNAPAGSADMTPVIPADGAQPVLEAAAAVVAADAAEDGFVAAREEVQEKAQPAKAPRVVYNPKNRRDPTLSPDDFLLLQYREQQRLAALESERQRKLAEERRKREEAERLRQLELARIKDPTREVRNKIRVGGIIGQEVFVGSKIYTVGKSIYGARIVEVRPDEVVFSYKGHKFVRKVQL